MSIKTMCERINRALWQRRFWGVLFTGFARMAMLLAAVGVDGLLSYLVSQRRRDVGILLTLGAAPSGVRAMIGRQGMLLVGAGLALGLLLSVGGSRLVAHLLVDVALYDWSTYAAVVAILVVAGLAASLWPAIRTSRQEPAHTLRSE